MQQRDTSIPVFIALKPSFRAEFFLEEATGFPVTPGGPSAGAQYPYPTQPWR